MAPLISFIIPVFNEAPRVAELLENLRRRYPDSQLIVVDGGSADKTVRAAMPRCDQLLLSGPGRARQMNLGGRVARGDYLFFLHADTTPTASAAQLAGCLAQAPAWGFCPVRLSGSRRVFRLIERAMNWRSRLTRVATGDQMLFLQRELFEQTEGFDDIPLMEDVAYCKRLRRLAAPVVTGQPVVTSSRRWEERGILRTVVTMWLLRLAYVLGVSPHRLHQFYYGH